MKKILLTILFTVLISVNTCLPVYATNESVLPLAIPDEIVITPTAEQTVWYTRIHNGILQRRLWSLTYQKWLTEWEDVGYVE